MPVFNEPLWLRRSIPRALDELDASPWAGHYDVVVIDDGSTDGTPGVLAEFAAERPELKVVRQDNAGRMAARTAGLEKATGDFVLFLDSRVLLRPGALRFLAENVSASARVWNGHVHVNTEGNRYALFWDALTRLAWVRYFGDPRTTSYGLDDFDHYPKGMGCFFAPREVLREAWQAFTTYYEDTRSANDDTSVIRGIAQRERIWLSPHFACDYFARQTLRQFVRHARARGTHFVDGHLRKDARFAAVIVAFYPVSATAVLALWWHWWLPPSLLAGAAAAAGAYVASRLDRPSGEAVAAMTPPFVLSFGAGMWRGAALALRARVAS